MDYIELKKRVLATQYFRLETYLIDGVQYVLEKGNATSPDHWMLWIFPIGQFADFEAGDSIEEVFVKAEQRSVPVSKLTLDAWHS